MCPLEDKLDKPQVIQQRGLRIKAPAPSAHQHTGVGGIWNPNCPTFCSGRSALFTVEWGEAWRGGESWHHQEEEQKRTKTASFTRERRAAEKEEVKEETDVWEKDGATRDTEADRERERGRTRLQHLSLRPVRVCACTCVQEKHGEGWSHDGERLHAGHHHRELRW